MYIIVNHTVNFKLCKKCLEPEIPTRIVCVIIRPIANHARAAAITLKAQLTTDLGIFLDVHFFSCSFGESPQGVRTLPVVYESP